MVFLIAHNSHELSLFDQQNLAWLLLPSQTALNMSLFFNHFAIFILTMAAFQIGWAAARDFQATRRNSQELPQIAGINSYSSTQYPLLPDQTFYSPSNYKTVYNFREMINIVCNHP